MRGGRFPLGSSWRYWTSAFLLFECSPVPIHPAASPETSPDQLPYDCAQAEAQQRAREQQRDAEIVLLRSELQKHPDDAESWARLGNAYRYADPASAIDAFDHATRSAPNVAEHWNQLGQAQWLNTAADPRAAEQSKAAFLNCLQRDPQNGDCHRWLGIVQCSQGNHTAALQSFTRAAEHGAANEYRMAKELLELGELEQSNVLIRTQLTRIVARPGNFDRLYELQELELQILVRRGNHAQAHAARQKLAEYARGISPETAFHLGSTYAVARPPQPTEATQLLVRFVQSSCDGRQTANDCDQCVVARDLLTHLTRTAPGMGVRAQRRQPSSASPSIAKPSHSAPSSGIPEGQGTGVHEPSTPTNGSSSRSDMK
jgi:Tfp pilus assembly protein PilF